MRLPDDGKYNKMSSANCGSTNATSIIELQNSVKIISVNEAQILSYV
jgi:hypothetical protein